MDKPFAIYIVVFSCGRNVKKFKLIFFLRRVVARFFNGPCTLNLVLPLHVPQKPAVLALNAVDLTGYGTSFKYILLPCRQGNFSFT